MTQPDLSTTPAVSPVPANRRPNRTRTLPDQRTLLSWLFVGRLVLAVGLLLGAGFVAAERPYESYIVSGVVLAVFAFTVYGGWTVYFRRTSLAAALPLPQVAVDFGLIAVVVYFAAQA